MEHPRVISWLAGAALYVLLFWIILAIVGRNDIVSVLFVGIAAAIIARQWRVAGGLRVTFAKAD